MKNINNEKMKKQSTLHHSKNSHSMKLLYNLDTEITVGMYAGLTFGYVLEFYGKKALPELLKYYDISNKIMEKYHCTLRPHQEVSQEGVALKDKPAVPIMNEDIPSAINVNMTDKIDKVVDSNDALDMSELVELDDDKWTSIRSDYDVLYDPEDDVPASFIDGILARGGMLNRYAGNAY